MSYKVMLDANFANDEHWLLCPRLTQRLAWLAAGGDPLAPPVLPEVRLILSICDHELVLLTSRLATAFALATCVFHRASISSRAILMGCLFRNVSSQHYCNRRAV